MRVLDAALTTKQQLGTATPYLRVYFDNRGGTTVAYTTRDATNYIWSIEQWEEPYAGVTIVRFRNSPNTTFNSVDYRGYSVSIGWGYELTGSPDTTWYSNAAVMKVLMQRDISLEGVLITEFYCVSKWYEVDSSYVFQGGNKIVGTIAGTFQIGELVTQATSGATGRLASVSGTYILVTRVAGVFAATYTCTGGTSGATCSAVSAPTDNYGDLVYASGDTTTEARIETITGLTMDVDADDPDGSMADTPKLAVAIGTSIRDVVGRMLLRTKCGVRYGNDSKLHALYLNTATAAQYAFDGTHAFLEDLRDRAIILPNTVYFMDVSPTGGIVATYVGTANDATSVAAIGTFVAPFQVDPDITSNAEGNTRAAAWIAQKVAQAYQGKITAPMECGLEVYDMVQAVDSRLGVTSKGRIGRIERQYVPGQGIYKVAMTLGSLYSEPSSMEPGTSGPDTGAQVGGLDKTPPTTAPVIFPWQLRPALLPYTLDIIFTAADQDDITWAAGTITFASKVTQAIDSGSLNLANANPYYLYCTVGDTSLNNTQTFGDSVGGENILVAFAVKGADASSKALVVAGTQGPKLFIDTLSSITANFGLMNAGEIRVGTGTLGSNFTGWRLWVESSIGRMAGYNSDVLQWYSDTDGKLYAGAGNVIVDSSGLSIKGSSFLKFYQSAALVGAFLSVLDTLYLTVDSGYHVNLGNAIGRLRIFDPSNTPNPIGVELVSDSGYGIAIDAGGNPPTPTADDLDLLAEDEVHIAADDRAYLAAGICSPNPAAGRVQVIAEDNVQIDGGVHVNIEAVQNINLTPGANYKTYVDRMASTPTDITASRAIDTTYTNGGYSKFVAVTVRINGSASVWHEAWLYTHASADPPTTIMAHCRNLNTAGDTEDYVLSTIVPPSWTYRLSTTGTVVLRHWSEVNIGV